MVSIRYIKGDIFTSTAQVIVNTVNCEGYMGKGLALAFKHRYPTMFATYQQECKTGRLHIGRPTLYKNSTPWILNFPTKNKWRANSKLEYLQKGLEYFVANYKKVGITSIAFPKLGAQNGKLEWDDVGPLMVKYLSQVDIDVYIYIAEGDKEFYADKPKSENKEVVDALKQFNEIALSVDRLRQEIQAKGKPINPQDAKRIATRRAESEFSSIDDIYAIEKLAQTSKNKIKAYLEQPCLTSMQLPGIAAELAPSQVRGKISSKRIRPKKSTSDTKEAESLFATYSEVS